MTRVLITGAAGFIGCATSAMFARAGFEVTGVDRVSRDRCGGAPPQLTLDFADRDLLRRVGSGEFDVVVHLAAVVDTTCRDRDLMLHENTEKAIDLAVQARRGGASFLSASSFGVYGKVERRRAVKEGEERGGTCSGPLNPYAESKLLLEDALAEVLDGATFWAALRFTNVFGTGEEHKGAMASMAYKLARASARGSAIALFDDTLDAARDYIPVGVVTARLRLMLASDGTPGIYNMGSSTPVSFADLLEWCRSRAGREPDVALVPNPHPERYQYWTSADMGRWRSEYAAGDASATIPRHVLRRAVERLVDAMQC